MPWVFGLVLKLTEAAADIVKFANMDPVFRDGQMEKSKKEFAKD